MAIDDLNQQLDNLTPLSSKVIEEITKSGGFVDKLENTNIFKITKDRNQKLIIGNYSSLIPYSIGIITGSRYNSREILKSRNLKIAQGQLFNFREKEEALAFAKRIKYPVVLRLENIQILGESFTNIKNNKEFISCYETISKYEENILVEKFHHGKIIRVFITESGFLNVTEKQYPKIVGDGKLKIVDLISKENLNRLNSKAQYAQPIVVDENILKKYGFNLTSVPTMGKKITLTNCTNARTGAVFGEITEITHPEILKISKKILKAFPKLPYISFELITKDYRKFSSKKYIISDIFLSPGPNINFSMIKGKTKKTAEKVFTELVFN